MWERSKRTGTRLGSKNQKSVLIFSVITVNYSNGQHIAHNVDGFAVGGAILLRRPWRRMMNDDTKDKFLFKSLIDKWQPEQKLNRTIGDDRRLRRPPLPQN